MKAYLKVVVTMAVMAIALVHVKARAGLVAKAPATPSVIAIVSIAVKGLVRVFRSIELI